jgi:hypothetical protein
LLNFIIHWLLIWRLVTQLQCVKWILGSVTIIRKQCSSLVFIFSLQCGFMFPPWLLSFTWWYCAGERLSPCVATGCFTIGVSILFFWKGVFSTKFEAVVSLFITLDSPLGFGNDDWASLDLKFFQLGSCFNQGSCSEIISIFLPPPPLSYSACWLLHVFFVKAPYLRGFMACIIFGKSSSGRQK